MASTAIENQFTDGNWDFFKDFEKDFDKHWDEITSKFGFEFTHFILQCMEDSGTLLAKAEDFHIKVVMDTNILFSQVMATLKNKRCFLKEWIENPFVEVYSPPKIKEEIYAKIDLKLPKNLSKEQAKAIASGFLDRIIIQEPGTGKEWVRAQELIGIKDEDDVQFLSISFEIESHGILTKDKHFREIPEVKIWDVHKIGKILTVYRKGTISFFVLAEGVPRVMQAIYDLGVIVLKTIIMVIESVIEVGKKILEGTVKALSKIPPEAILISAAIYGLALLFSEKVREGSAKAVEFLAESVEIVGEALSRFIQNVFEVMKAFVQLIMPFAAISIKGLGYLFWTFALMVEEAEMLERERCRVN